MSDSGQNGETRPWNNGGRKRHPIRPLKELEWEAIRRRYESTTISQRDLSKELGVSYSTLSKRAMREKWNQAASLIHEARESLVLKTSEALSEATSRAADMAAKQLVDELQPWIAQQKTEQIKRALLRSQKAQDRLDKISLGYDVVTKDGDLATLSPGPKEESFIASAEDKYDNIIRRNLGMNDSATFNGSLSVNILTRQAAVQVTQP